LLWTRPQEHAARLKVLIEVHPPFARSFLGSIRVNVNPRRMSSVCLASMPRRLASLAFARKLGARIRAVREHVGITQETLAWDTEFAKAHLSQLEAGKSVPSLPALYALARRLHVDALELLAVDPKKEPLHRLVDAVRRGDESAVEKSLRALGFGRTESHKPALMQVAEEHATGPKKIKRRG